MGNSVTSIGQCAFYTCYNLKNIVFYEGLTNIGHAAFYGCPNLISITIPGSVTSIGSDAFKYCSALTRIDYKSTISNWESITKYIDWDLYTGEYLVYCTDGITIAD